MATDLIIMKLVKALKNAVRILNVYKSEKAQGQGPFLFGWLRCKPSLLNKPCMLAVADAWYFQPIRGRHEAGTSRKWLGSCHAPSTPTVRMSQLRFIRDMH
eukprot:6197366-Pleurochrysis_carterae.AAC.3